MPSLSQLAKLALLFTSITSVAAHPKFLRPRLIEIRQDGSVATPLPAAPTVAPNAGAAAPALTPAAAAPQAAPPAPMAANTTTTGLTDIDILQL
jgi:hypothetical protein